MRNPQSFPKTHQTFITEVEVEQLFNLYSYRLAVDEKAAVDLSRLIILYGDNGSGKTTLLSMIFHLLSPAQGQNHRTFLASTAFQRFAVRLGTDLYIEIQREAGQLLGAFRATIRRGAHRIFDRFISVKEKNSRVVVDRDDQDAIDFSGALESLGITLYYLSDDRTTETSVSSAEEDTQLVLFDDDEPEMIVRAGRVIKRQKSAHREPNLEIAIFKLERWLRSEALKGSSQGEANTNTIYADIVKRIARARRVGPKSKSGAADSRKSVGDVVQDLRELEERSKAYSEYALITPVHLGGLIDTFDTSSSDTKRIIADVLIPYVDGLKARLDALKSIQKLIRLFIDSINSFFHNKYISFDLSGGLQITARNGDRLKPGMLSSGERQILLLFCNTITARDQASIFIIDEPELSLNIKWQRKLLQVLLQCTRDSAVQFVIATHSIELITRHKQHVLRLIG